MYSNKDQVVKMVASFGLYRPVCMFPSQNLWQHTFSTLEKKEKAFSQLLCYGANRLVGYRN